MNINEAKTADDYFNLFSGETLAQSSRSLYLTFRLFPVESRPSITLFYLLARAFDNIADTKEIATDLRLLSLQNLMKIINNESSSFMADQIIQPLLPLITKEKDKDLVNKIPQFLNWLNLIPNADKQDIFSILRLIMAGDEIDLSLFRNPKEIHSINSYTELLEYCYLQASGVAEIVTKMLCRQNNNFASLDNQRMIFLANQWGTGLQFINILRDIPADLNDGRCYIPSQALQEVGLTPQTILKEPERLIPILNSMHKQTVNYLDQWFDYSLAINNKKLRYSMILAVMITMNTLILLKDISYIKNQERVKLSRRQIKHIMFFSKLSFLPKSWLKAYYFKLRKRAMQNIVAPE